MIKNDGSPFARFHPKKVSIKWKPLLWFVKGGTTNSLDYISDFIESKSAEKTTFEWEQSPIEAEHVISRLISSKVIGIWISHVIMFFSKILNDPIDRSRIVLCRSYISGLPSMSRGSKDLLNLNFHWLLIVNLVLFLLSRFLVYITQDPLKSNDISAGSMGFSILMYVIQAQTLMT